MPLRAVAAARRVRGLGYSLYAVASLRWAHGFEIQTVRSLSKKGLLQYSILAGEKQQTLQLNRVGRGGFGQTTAPSTVHEVLRSPGQPLDAATRAFMKPRDSAMTFPECGYFPAAGSPSECSATPTQLEAG